MVIFFPNYRILSKSHKRLIMQGLEEYETPMITNSRGRLLHIAAKQTFCTSQVGNTACHSV